MLAPGAYDQGLGGLLDRDITLFPGDYKFNGFFQIQINSEGNAIIAGDNGSRVGIVNGASFRRAIHSGSVFIGGVNPTAAEYDIVLDQGPLEILTEWVIVQKDDE